MDRDGCETKRKSSKRRASLNTTFPKIDPNPEWRRIEFPFTAGGPAIEGFTNSGLNRNCSREIQGMATKVRPNERGRRDGQPGLPLFPKSIPMRSGEGSNFHSRPGGRPSRVSIIQA